MDEDGKQREFDNLMQSHQFQIEEEKAPPRGNKYLRCIRSNGLTLATIAAVVLGAVTGFILRSAVEDRWSQRNVMYIGFLGDLFLRVLKALILPLIISSLVSAISSLDLSLSKRIAFRTIAFYMATTFFAVIEGIILVTTIRPGDKTLSTSNSSENQQDPRTQNSTTVDTLLDLVRNMFPPNLVQACIEQAYTNLIPNEDETDMYKWKIGDEGFKKGTNILGMVVFSVVLGIAVAQIGEPAKPVKDFFKSMMVIVMKITHWVITLSPGGVFFLVTAKIIAMDDMGEVLTRLGWYFSTVVAGLCLHGFVVLPTLYFLLTRKSPFTYVYNLKTVLATAFGTASSAATLPLTIEALENNSGIDPRITRFALPIGATINLDGTALYEAVAAIFIAQSNKIQLSIGQLAAVSITATAASMGAAGIPQAGLVTMVLVLDTVGLPAKEVGTILAVDWLLDRFRTTINVMGDAFGAGIVNHHSRSDLNKMKN